MTKHPARWFTRAWLRRGAMAGLWLLLLASTAATALASSPALPPRPMPGEGGYGGNGGNGRIVLHIALPAADAGHVAAWQQLWTVVQWQDGLGRWNNVEAWQGAPQGNPGDADHRAYVIDDKDLGKGPFRWVVLQSRGGATAGTSQPFNLPKTAGDSVRVDVAVSLAAVVQPATVVFRLQASTPLKWQSLGTGLEWSDGSTLWYEVVGWYASFDGPNGNGAIRTMRVPDSLRGQGQFRFAVYVDRERGPTAVSPSFRMPAQPGQSATVTAVLN